MPGAMSVQTLHHLGGHICWWYRKYAPDNNELMNLKKDTRQAKKGLWADPRSVPPWEWRKRSRGACALPHR